MQTYYWIIWLLSIYCAKGVQFICEQTLVLVFRKITYTLSLVHIRSVTVGKVRELSWPNQNREQSGGVWKSLKRSKKKKFPSVPGCFKIPTRCEQSLKTYPLNKKYSMNVY